MASQPQRSDEPRALRLSVLDLATVVPGSDPAGALRASVDLARLAERSGFTRHWFAEHHNMESVFSSSPAVLAGYLAANTERIRVGAGGVMLPNHAPLLIAEQFGTLATIYPDRIDLGLGRAPGTTPETVLALRRDPSAAERFPADVRELQGYLADPRPGQRVLAVPGQGTHVPLYILGSSLFGAQLAAAYGLPYGFASHFAPAELERATALYRDRFQPSDQLGAPYVIAGVNVFCADTDAVAEELFRAGVDALARRLATRALPEAAELDDEALMASPFGRQARIMLTCSAVGAPDRVREYLLGFAAHAHADELIVAMNLADPAPRLRSYELLAEAFAGELGAGAGARQSL